MHTGHDRAFVYDIADLYKADITIPVAFTVVSGLGTEVDTQTLSTTVRRHVRDRIREEKVISRCVKDLKLLMKEPLENEEFGEVIELWDYSRGTI
ncbi:type I-E CRISPR-associated endonuclease Cas1, partial [Gardnerella leopoldii]|nr:type I-E CRISPR-associated endonuclease Cas1 [Gardnerella leopoldii]